MNKHLLNLALIAAAVFTVGGVTGAKAVTLLDLNAAGSQFVCGDKVFDLWNSSLNGGTAGLENFSVIPLFASPTEVDIEIAGLLAADANQSEDLTVNFRTSATDGLINGISLNSDIHAIGPDGFGDITEIVHAGSFAGTQLARLVYHEGDDTLNAFFDPHDTIFVSKNISVVNGEALSFIIQDFKQVPEPGSIALFTGMGISGGLIGLCLRRRR